MADRRSPVPGSPEAPLILASSSPRRAMLLGAAGIVFDACPVEVDETPRAGEPPCDYVLRLAVDKARAASRLHPQRLSLGADTTVVLDDRILGKPADPADAEAMLARLAGRTHQVLTGVALVGGQGTAAALAETTVRFSRMTLEDIRRYVATGEPLDKAGAYAIQGPVSRFVEGIHGSYTNVVGLPVALVYRMLMRYPDGWEGVRLEP